MSTERRLSISEIFYSLQGEGPYVGRPFVFVRLGECVEPFCPFCDTKYAWNNHEKLTINEIIYHISKFKCKNVVITGGEPFLQWESGLRELIDILSKKSFFIQYETSGKILIPKQTKGIVICSPKFLDNKWYFNHNNISRVDFFKFLFVDDKSQKAILEFIEKYNISRKKVYIMPLGDTKQAQLKLMPQVFEFCRTYGFNMSLRLHILCFDIKKSI